MLVKHGRIGARGHVAQLAASIVGQHRIYVVGLFAVVIRAVKFAQIIARICPAVRARILVYLEAH